MDTLPAAETPGPITVVDREGATVQVTTGTTDYPVRLHTALGHDGGSTVVLSRDEALALTGAVCALLTLAAVEGGAR